MSSQIEEDGATEKVRRVKKVKKVKKSEVVDVASSESTEASQVAEDVHSDSSSMTSTSKTTTHLEEGPAEGEVVTKTTKTVKKKIIKTGEGGDEVVETTTTTTTTVEGTGDHVDDSAKEVTVSHEAHDGADHMEGHKTKKIIKKKKIVKTNESAGDAVDSCATEKISSDAAAPEAEKGESKAEEVAVPTVVETGKEGAEVSQASTVSEVVADSVVDEDAPKEVKKKKILKKKKVVEHAEGEVAQEATATSELPPETVVVEAAASSGAGEKVNEVSPDVAVACPAIPDEDQAEKVEKITSAELPSKETVAEHEEVQKVETELVAEERTVVSPAEDKVEEAHDVKLVAESKEIKEEKEVVIEESKPIEVKSEIDGKATEECKAAVDKEETISQKVEEHVISNEVKVESSKPVEEEVSVEEKAIALEGMDDTVGVSMNSTVVTTTIKQVPNILEQEIAKKKAFQQKLLQSEIMIESARIASDPNKIILPPAIISIKNLVAKEEKLQNDLRSIRLNYGNLDTELDYIRNELNSRLVQRPRPAHLVQAAPSTKIRSSTVKKRSTRRQAV